MRVVSIVAFFALVSACGNHEPVTSPTPASSSSAVAQPPAPKDVAYKLVITTASCLLGGLWGDAEGEAGGAERRNGTARRCAAVVHTVTGADDPTKVEALRMLDASITDPLLAKVKELAPADGLDAAHAAELVQLETSLVNASREATAARHAAAKLRADVERIRNDKDKAAARDRDADRLSGDEANVVPALHAGAALDALVHTPGSYAAEGHAIGVLLALSRVRAAQDLPKHMKLYTVAPAYSAVFGVAPPALPEHAKDRLKPGAWLTYVTAVAAACGHAVPATATKPKEKEPLAWSGVLSGFADRLKTDLPQLKDEGLAEAVKGTIERLEARSAAVSSAAAAEPH